MNRQFGGDLEEKQEIFRRAKATTFLIPSEKYTVYSATHPAII